MADIVGPTRVFEDTMQSDLAYLIGQMENHHDDVEDSSNLNHNDDQE